MLSNRPYRNSLTLEYCKNEIISNSKIMYDPDIVNVVVQNWDNIIKKYYLK